MQPVHHPWESATRIPSFTHLISLALTQPLLSGEQMCLLLWWGWGSCCLVCTGSSFLIFWDKRSCASHYIIFHVLSDPDSLNFLLDNHHMNAALPSGCRCAYLHVMAFDLLCDLISETNYKEISSSHHVFIPWKPRLLSWAMLTCFPSSVQDILEQLWMSNIPQLQCTASKLPNNEGSNVTKMCLFYEYSFERNCTCHQWSFSLIACRNVSVSVCHSGSGSTLWRTLTLSSTSTSPTSLILACL